MFAIIYNQQVSEFIALPASEGLSDIAFEKGWRMFEGDMSNIELVEMEKQVKVIRYEPTQFFLDYLSDVQLTEEDIAYIEACRSEPYFEQSVVANENDEEIDHEFHFQEAPITEDTEYNTL